MGRRSGSVNKSKRKRKSENKNKKYISIDLIGGILIVLSVILFIFLTLNNIGSVGVAIKSIFLGIFGVGSFLLPVILVYLGIIFILADNNINVTGKIIQGIILVILISAVAYSFKNTNLDIMKDFGGFVESAYTGGTTLQNAGGVLGGVLTATLSSLIGVVATNIILIATLFFMTLFILNITVRKIAIFFGALFAWFGHNTASAIKNGVSKQKTSKEEKYNKKLERIKESKFEEIGSKESVAHLKKDTSDQIIFDLGKFDDKKEEELEKAKMQRDEFFKKQKEEKEDKTVKEVLQLEHVKHIEEQTYNFPPISLLSYNKEKTKGMDKKAIQTVALRLQKTLSSFGVEAKVTNITKGPTVTRYELTPSVGVKVSKIVNLADDIALNLAAKTIRIEAPIPGKAAVGIEVPNEINEAVFLREVIESEEFKNHKSKLAFALGKDTSGDIVVGDIAKMPHVLIAGATGSGKSVCINTIITSILYKAKPSEVKLMLIDPKMVELSGYNGIPHLLIPVVTDPRKAAGALNWAVQEMVNRYTLFASKGVKEINGYNAVIEKENKELENLEEGQTPRLPQIVIIIDELSDLMMVAPNDVEDAICRLAQMARAAGMHLVIATQRPSVDVITGIIKANVPSRIAFTVSSQVDSRTILDMAGAEKLLGRGDMLYFPTGESKPVRIQGSFVSETEVENIVENIKKNCTVTYNEDIIEKIERGNNKKDSDDDETDDDVDVLLNESIELAISIGQTSASMLQRKFKIGHSRAGRIIDQMEQRGIVSGYEGSKPRRTLISKEEWQETKMTTEENIEE